MIFLSDHEQETESSVFVSGQLNFQFRNRQLGCNQAFGSGLLQLIWVNPQLSQFGLGAFQRLTHLIQLLTGQIAFLKQLVWIFEGFPIRVKHRQPICKLLKPNAQ